MKYLLTIVFTLIFLSTKSQIRLGGSLPTDSSNIILQTKLGIPFGMISKLEVEVYDGDSLNMKAYQGLYLLKINSINNKAINDTLILTFTDETETLASDDFNLYKLIYKKNIGSLTGKQIDKMKKQYVGKKFTVMAYESGQFSGMPKDYFDYRPIKSGTGFYFDHYLVIVSNLTR